MQDTIAAIATPPGTGGIGVIRVSGNRAEQVARLLFIPSREPCGFASHRLYHGYIIAPESGVKLDEALLALLKKPLSFTGEDTVEFYCHGGPLILNSILEEILKSGCRPATPGEFTKRAFLNGRLDLSQAEAVLDMITAQTDRGRDLALSHLMGALSEKISGLYNRIMDILAVVEIAIDFSGDELSEDRHDSGKIQAEGISRIINELQELVSTYAPGRIIREGASVVIIGRPNVGKSSLLNALLGEKRAIVTPVPGTTRDLIEESVAIGDIVVKLTDTAGIRAPENIIEEEGIALVRERVAAADLAVMLLDGSEELTAEDLRIIDDNREKNLLVAVNKSDLPSRIDLLSVARRLPEAKTFAVSAKFGSGLEDLKKAIRGAVIGMNLSDASGAILTNIRHKNAAEEAVRHLSQARDGILNLAPPELVAVDLGDALAGLGEITGRNYGEEILERIFSRFCIGK